MTSNSSSYTCFFSSWVRSWSPIRTRGSDSLTSMSCNPKVSARSFHMGWFAPISSAPASTVLFATKSRSVRTRPPSRSEASSTATSTPQRFRYQAAESPANPPPTTTTLMSCNSSLECTASRSRASGIKKESRRACRFDLDRSARLDPDTAEPTSLFSCSNTCAAIVSTSGRGLAGTEGRGPDTPFALGRGVLTHSMRGEGVRVRAE